MTKDAVIAILKNENSYISGEKISTALGISRAAVNAAVRSLRKEGYIILSSTNKGYLLESAPDTLHTGDLMALLSAKRMKDVICLDRVDSTNRYLGNLALDGAPDGQIVLSGEQTDGRGRRGRTFFSPRGKGLYLSMLLRPFCAPTDVSTITAWTAVAVMRAIEEVCGMKPGIKWVNDLFLNGKKISGILTEMSVESESGHIQHVIIGIGLNVSETRDDFPEELTDTAGSLLTETGTHYSRAALAAAIIQKLDELRLDWSQEKQAYLDAYRTNNIVIGKSILVRTGNTTTPAIAEGISDNFELQVLYPDHTTASLSSGEVSLLLTPEQ